MNYVEALNRLSELMERPNEIIITELENLVKEI